ncbi:MAG: 2-phospho-L-lactate guanylyltransferase [Nitrososphaerota archaeon]
MKLAALVPLNARSRVKSRLAGALDPADRAELARWLAQGVLDAMRAADIAHVGVVSPDDDVLRWAWHNGAQAIRQHGAGLNDALDVGRAWALRQSADALLIVLGDLPLLTAEDVLALTAHEHTASSVPSVTIAPDRANQGTNMLLVRPPAAISFAFGENSLAQHLALAHAAGIEPRIIRRPGAAFDVDTPADLRELADLGLWRPSGAHRHLWAGEAS